MKKKNKDFDTVQTSENQEELNAPKEKGRVRSARKKSGKLLMAMLIFLITILTILNVIVIFIMANGWGDLGRTKPNRSVDKTQKYEDVSKVTDSQGNAKTDEQGHEMYLHDGQEVPLLDSYNFLVLGQDKKAMLTDVMMLVNLNTENNKVSVMQFPRDTFIKVSTKACMNCESVPYNQSLTACPDCNASLTTVGNGYGQKMNSVYNTYYSALRSKKSGLSEEELTTFGMKGLSAEIEQNLHITIDYQIHMDLQGFRDIVDAIGGVDMYVPYNMKYSDPGQNLYINLKEGQQTLNGDKAEQFVRFRASYVNGDLGRQDAQKLFMVAFFKNFKEKVSLTNVFSIVSAMMEHVTHTIPSEDLDYFGRQVLSMDFSNITMLSAPNTPIYIGNGSYVVLHRKALLDVVNSGFLIFGGNYYVKDEYFDVERNFTTNDASVKAIYETDKEFDGEKSAEDINNNGIDVNRAW